MIRESGGPGMAEIVAETTSQVHTRWESHLGLGIWSGGRQRCRMRMLVTASRPRRCIERHDMHALHQVIDSKSSAQC